MNKSHTYLLLLIAVYSTTGNSFASAYKNADLLPNTDIIKQMQKTTPSGPAPIYVTPDDLSISIESIKRKPQFKKLFKLAQTGNARAQYELGQMFYKRTTFNLENIVAQKEALKWYRLAATHGDRDAQDMLGEIIWNGEAGIIRNETEAEKWFRKSALQGQTDAQNSLGYMYDGHNHDDTHVDYKEAYKWYKLSAEQDNTDSMEPLAYLYRDGTGIKKDLVEAYKWIYLANNGVVMFGRFAGAPQRTIEEFEQGMTKEQVAEGKLRAKNWRPIKGAHF